VEVVGGEHISSRSGSGVVERLLLSIFGVVLKVKRTSVVEGKLHHLKTVYKLRKTKEL
jgi:hypothetical protein